MSRSAERKIIYAASCWQLLTGIVTMFFYAFYIKKQGAELQLTGIEQKGMESLFNNLYSFAVTYGLLFIVIAIVNVILTKRLMKDSTLQYKLPVYLIVLAVAFYFLTDFISLTLCLMAAVIALAKNRPQKILLEGADL